MAPETGPFCCLKPATLQSIVWRVISAFSVEAGPNRPALTPELCVPGTVHQYAEKVTSTGVRRWVVVPSPSWPKELSPQQETRPLF